MHILYHIHPYTSTSTYIYIHTRICTNESPAFRNCPGPERPGHAAGVSGKRFRRGAADRRSLRRLAFPGQVMKSEVIASENTHMLHGAGIYLPTKLSDFVRVNVVIHIPYLEHLGYKNLSDWWFGT